MTYGHLGLVESNGVSLITGERGCYEYQPSEARRAVTK